MTLTIKFKNRVTANESMDIIDDCKKIIKEYGLSYKSSAFANNQIVIVIGEDDSDTVGSCIVELTKMLTTRYHNKNASIYAKHDIEIKDIEKGMLKMREPKELKDTVNLMNSDEYKERFVAEYYQTKIRYDKLKAMIENWDKGELKFEPTCPRSTYEMQLSGMGIYLATLEARAKIEGIGYLEPSGVIL
jgi:hypothetical protein